MKYLMSKNHFEEYAESLLNIHMSINSKNQGLKFLDIGGNDGVLAMKMHEKKAKTYLDLAQGG